MHCRNNRLVGNELVQVLNDSNLKVDEFICAASERSKGKEIEIRGKHYAVTPADACEMKPDIAIFPAGSEVSKEWAPRLQQTDVLLSTIVLSGACVMKFPCCTRNKR